MHAKWRRCLAIAGALALLVTPGVAYATDNPGEKTPGDPSDTAPAFGLTLLEDITAVVEENPTLSTEAVMVEVGFEGEGGLQAIVEDDLLSVTVAFHDGPTTLELEAVHRLASVSRVLEFAQSATAWVAPANLRALEEVPGVAAVTINMVPDTAFMDRELSEEESAELAADVAALATRPQGSIGVQAASTNEDDCRAIPAVANQPLKVNEARDAWDVDGNGVKVGIISLSYGSDPSARTSPAEDISAGLLPGPGNPCGYTTPVQIISDGTLSASQRNDEGRAMAQIVHGIAPGAELLFADVGVSPEETAQNIIELANAGADLIVDDVFWASELNFQHGIISQAVETVKARGVTYLASSGNNNGVKRYPNASVATGYPIGRHQSNQFIGMPCPSWVVPPEGSSNYDCLDFSPTGTGVAWGEYTMNSVPTQPSHTIQWAEPAGGVTTALQLQLYGVNPRYQNGTVVGTDYCLGAASVLQKRTMPLALVSWTSSSSPNPNCRPTKTISMVVVRDKAGPYGAPTVQLTPWGSNTSTAPVDRMFYESEGNNTIQGSQYGHHGDGTSGAIAAAPWNKPTSVQWYSSLGANQTRFSPYRAGRVSTPLAVFKNPQAPVVMGVDGIVNNFFGSPITTGSNSGLYAFFGTSAAAPTVAGVVALSLELDAELKPEMVDDLLRETANAAVTNPYSLAPVPFTSVVGAGLVDAEQFLAAVSQEPPDPGGTTDPSPTTVTRYGGLDRYATNASLNADTINATTPVFVASGQTFADALSVGPAVSKLGGALLLTMPGRLPTQTAHLIKNGQPKTIFVVGGPGAVSANVQRELQSLAPQATIERVGGSDRYATSMAILNRFFSDGAVGLALLATGADYPDALSAAAAGGVLNAPVLLVKGRSAKSLPSDAITFLKNRGTNTVLLVGGSGVLNDSLLVSARRSFPAAARLWGQNRYETNMAVNEYLNRQPGANIDDIWFATGRVFPDALSAAVPAGHAGGRLVLALKNCVPVPVVSSWIDASKYGSVVQVSLVGGQEALGQGIFDLQQCAR